MFAGAAPFASDALVFPSDTYGPYRPSSNVTATPVSSRTPSSRSTVRVADWRRLVCFGAANRASAGRFGPYVKHGDEFRSLDPDDDVYTVSLERALATISWP